MYFCIIIICSCGTHEFRASYRCHKFVFMSPACCDHNDIRAPPGKRHEFVETNTNRPPAKAMSKDSGPTTLNTEHKHSEATPANSAHLTECAVFAGEPIGCWRTSGPASRESPAAPRASCRKPPCASAGRIRGRSSASVSQLFRVHRTGLPVGVGGLEHIRKVLGLLFASALDWARGA